jgi:hypothetical protein
MVTAAELEKHIIQAGQVEQLKILPPHPSFFQQKTFEIVTEVVGYELDGLEFQVICQESLRRLLPLVDFLTQPRSITEFQDLKRELLETVWKYDPYLRERRGEALQSKEEAQIGWVVDWLSRLLPELGIFLRDELDNLAWEAPENVWKIFEDVPPQRYLPMDEKIVTHQEAVKLANQISEAETGRIGFIAGKWRLGCHSEHIDLFEGAKNALGLDGFLLVSVESQRSVWQRCGQDQFVLPDRERLQRIAAVGAIDCVILHDPPEDELGNLGAFYERVQEELGPNLWFIGSKDNRWREEFVRRASEVGAILLWDRPTTSISTSEIVARIKQTR